MVIISESFTEIRNEDNELVCMSLADGGCTCRTQR